MRDSLQLRVREGAEEAARLILLRSFSRFCRVLSCAPDNQRLPISSSCKHRSLCVTNLRSTVHRHFHFPIMSITLTTTRVPSFPHPLRECHATVKTTTVPSFPHRLRECHSQNRQCAITSMSSRVCHRCHLSAEKENNHS